MSEISYHIERLANTMRTMAWQRAKGELRSMTDTFIGIGKLEGEKYDALEKAINKFIAEIEDNALHE